MTSGFAGGHLTRKLGLGGRNVDDDSSRGGEV